jgi:hypothetical protein
VANAGLLIPLIPAAGVAVFIISALRKGQIDMTHIWLPGTASCYRAKSPRNFWLFIGAAGLVGLAFIGLTAFLAWAQNSN